MFCSHGYSTFYQLCKLVIDLQSSLNIEPWYAGPLGLLGYHQPPDCVNMKRGIIFLLWTEMVQ